MYVCIKFKFKSLIIMPHCAPTYSNALPYPTPRNDTMLYIHITSNQYTKKITQN